VAHRSEDECGGGSCSGQTDQLRPVARLPQSGQRATKRISHSPITKMQARFCRIVTKCNFRMRRFHRYIKDPSYWCARANEMRAAAAEVTDPKVKATAFGAADAYDKLAQLEKGSPASELPDATPHPVVEKERTLLDGLRSVRNFAAVENWKGNDQPPQATIPMAATTGGGEISS
jgi:hypothetical protein